MTQLLALQSAFRGTITASNLAIQQGLRQHFFMSFRCLNRRCAYSSGAIATH
jgi:hypothetical protein